MGLKLNGSASAGGAEVTPRTFPYSNWGPLAALLGVVAALFAGVLMGLPGLLLGTEHGSVQKYDIASGSAELSIGDEDSSDIAVGASGGVLADRETEVRVFGADGGEADTVFGNFEASRGIALDGRTGSAYVSDESAGDISVYRDAEGAAKLQTRFGTQALPPPLAPGFKPERLAVAPSGKLYVIDRGSNSVLEFSTTGAYSGRLDASPSSAGSFEFGDAESNDVAIDASHGAGRGNVYVVAGDDEDGSVLAFDRAGAFLWELPSEGREFCGVAVDGSGHLWLAESEGGVGQYALASKAGKPPTATGRSVDTESSSCAIALGAQGALFASHRADGELSTAANIFVQTTTAIGFLMVPFLLAMSRGASFREAAGRLGLRRFKRSALLWIGAAILVYLVVVALYVNLIGEPKQEDIAKGFGIVPVQVLLIVIAAPISEEICFRGMLFGGLRERLPRLGAALISALIFGGLHATTGVSAVPPLIVFGFLLALLYEKTGSVIPGILLHMLNNSVALLGQ